MMAGNAFSRTTGALTVIGLVGGIGAGKSFVAERFAERGALVLDADRAGHRALERPKVIEDLTNAFGAEILGETGSIDRRRLGAIVFKDEGSRHLLESMVHPVMRREFEDRIESARNDSTVPLLILDAAILFEAGWNDLCDSVLFVDADPQTRLRRVSSSRSWSAEELTRRENSQMPLDKKKARADSIVRNDGSLAEVGSQVDTLFRRWARPTPRDCSSS